MQGFSCSQCPLHVFKINTIKEKFKHCQGPLPSPCTALASNGPQLLYADSEKTLPRGFHHNDADLLLITDDSSIPTNQHQLFQQEKVFTVLILEPS